MYDERPREFGGLLTLKQVGYLAGALVMGVSVILQLPRAMSTPVLVLCLLAGVGLAFGNWRGLPADRLLWLWVQYLGRPRCLAWQRDER